MFISCMSLTHWGRVTHICVRNITVAWTAPSHYLNQCRNIVNWTLGNKRQWNLDRNSYIFIQENAFENVDCEMMSISSRPQCVNARTCIILTPQTGPRTISYIAQNTHMGFTIVCSFCRYSTPTQRKTTYQWPLLLTWFNFNHSMDK